MCFQLLDWDTHFFGISVARLDAPSLTPETLSSVCGELETQGVRLAYWSSTVRHDDGAMATLGGRLVDAKTTYFIDLNEIGVRNLPRTDGVVTYDPSMSREDLENLAVQCGEYSRFAVDPRVPREKFAELYRRWMQQSIDKKLASEVLVVREANRVAGMVTLGDKHGRGDIGLLAVDRDFRGRRYAQRLVCAAQRWFLEHGYVHGQVVTQGQNLPACRLYEKCGYTIEKVEYFYHIWLGQQAQAA